MGCSPFFVTNGSHPTLPLDIIEVTWLVDLLNVKLLTAELIGYRVRALAKHKDHIEHIRRTVSKKKLDDLLHYEQEHCHMIIGCVAGSSKGKSLLTLPGGVNTFDLVHGVAHESNDHRGTILLPIRWVELTCTERNSIELDLSPEKSILDLSVVDTCTLQGINVASIGMMPFLDRSKKWMNKF